MTLSSNQGTRHPFGHGRESVLAVFITLAGLIGPSASALGARDDPTVPVSAAGEFGSPDNQSQQVITVTAPAPVTAAFGTTFEVASAASSNLPVTITSSGACTGSGSGTARVTMLSGSGSCLVRFNQPGDTDYLAAAEVTNETVAGKAEQTVAAAAVYASAFEVVAASSSGLPVTIVTSGVCQGVGTSSARVTMTSGTGTCKVHYQQAGDANYQSAAEVSNEIMATKAAQVIRVRAAPPARAAYGSTFEVAATASSNLLVAISASGACVGSGDGLARITMNRGTGTCTLHYKQVGDTNFLPAAEVTGDVAADQAVLAVTSNPSAPIRQYSDGNPPLAPTYSGFVAGEGVGVLAEEPRCSTTAGPTSAPGSYPITCTGGQALNYRFTYDDAAVLTVVPEDAMVGFAHDNPAAVKAVLPTIEREAKAGMPPGRSRRERVATVAKGRETRSREGTVRSASGPSSSNSSKGRGGNRLPPAGALRAEAAARSGANRGQNGLSPGRESVRRQEPPYGIASEKRHSFNRKYSRRLNLRFVVKEKQPDTAAYGAAAGDLDSAALTVTLSPLMAGGSIKLNCKAAPVSSSGYEGHKTFTCANATDLGVDVYEVNARVTGNYAGEGFDGLSVFDQGLGSPNGGGWFFWPGTEDKTYFGFVMRAAKKDVDRQGHLLVVRHHTDGTLSRLRSRTLTGAVLLNDPATGCGTVTFSGKAEYLARDPSANAGIGGVAGSGDSPFMAYAEDCNHPGTGLDYFLVRAVGDLQMPADVYANKVPLVDHGHILVPHRAQKVRDE